MDNELRILRGLGRIASAVEAGGFSSYADDLRQIRHELRECFRALLDRAMDEDEEWDEDIELEEGLEAD